MFVEDCSCESLGLEERTNGEKSRSVLSAISHWMTEKQQILYLPLTPHVNEMQSNDTRTRMEGVAAGGSYDRARQRSHLNQCS